MAELQQGIEGGSSVNAWSYVSEGFFGLGEDDDPLLDNARPISCHLQ